MAMTKIGDDKPKKKPKMVKVGGVDETEQLFWQPDEEGDCRYILMRSWSMMMMLHTAMSVLMMMMMMMTMMMAINTWSSLGYTRAPF